MPQSPESKKISPPIENIKTFASDLQKLDLSLTRSEKEIGESSPYGDYAADRFREHRLNLKRILSNELGRAITKAKEEDLSRDEIRQAVVRGKLTGMKEFLELMIEQLILKIDSLQEE